MKEKKVEPCEHCQNGFIIEGFLWWQQTTICPYCHGTGNSQTAKKLKNEILR